MASPKARSESAPPPEFEVSCTSCIGDICSSEVSAAAVFPPVELEVTPFTGDTGTGVKSRLSGRTLFELERPPVLTVKLDIVSTLMRI